MHCDDTKSISTANYLILLIKWTASNIPNIEVTCNICMSICFGKISYFNSNGKERKRILLMAIYIINYLSCFLKGWQIGFMRCKEHHCEICTLQYEVCSLQFCFVLDCMDFSIGDFVVLFLFLPQMFEHRYCWWHDTEKQTSWQGINVHEDFILSLSCYSPSARTHTHTYAQICNISQVYFYL